MRGSRAYEYQVSSPSPRSLHGDVDNPSPINLSRLSICDDGWSFLGSTAMNIAHVACGRVDAYYDKGGYGGPWDVAAGLAILSEAGGTYTKLCGSKFVIDYGKGDLVCGNPDMVQTVLTTIRDAGAIEEPGEGWVRTALLVAAPAVVAFGLGLMVGREALLPRGGRRK